MAQSLASAGESAPPLNSLARAETIREAVRWLAERQAEVKALNAEINEYRLKYIKGDLGFKLADWNALFRVSQLEAEDRDELLECVREGFAALGIGGSVDWVDAAQTTGSPSRSVSRPPLTGNGGGASGSLRQSPATPPDQAARAWGRSDGLGGAHDHAGDYPQGEPGHGDYMLGLADGEAERDRINALGNGAGAPKRPRGRPRKQPQEAEADAEF